MPLLKSEVRPAPGETRSAQHRTRPVLLLSNSRTLASTHDSPGRTANVLTSTAPGPAESPQAEVGGISRKMTLLESAEDRVPLGRPLALIAEDNLQLRENTVRMLGRRGIAVIPVSSYTQAASALMVSPRVDVAMLDIHLHFDKDVLDKGGLDIARMLRALSTSPTIIGYSGKFNEDELSDEELDLFDETRAKGHLTIDDQRELWDLCAELARRSYENRRYIAEERFEQLRRQYEASVPSLEIIRRLRMDNSDAQEFTAEGALGLAGYRVRIVALGNPGQPDAPARNFVVWAQDVVDDEQTWVNLEVYEHHDLYSTGPTEQAALEALAEFMALTRADLLSIEGISPSDARLFTFLDKLLA